MSEKTSNAKPASSNDPSLLVNDLTVADARHLLKTEGGKLDASQISIRLVSTAAVAIGCAYAIWAGHATVWHLALPMVAEYCVLLVAMPLLYLVIRHEALRKDAVGAVRLLAIALVVAVIAGAVRTYQTGVPWKELLAADLNMAWVWVRDHKISWAILAAMAGVLLELPGRLVNFKKFGPPFSPVGLGCGMRVAVLCLGVFLLPVVMSGSATRNAWILLGVLVLADILALVMHLDIQRRLEKLDARTER
jgi:hypothetical protein